jgi:antitoxin (DNA-binding transcriptional repressor) of toxin-antitoxin stability system
VPFQWAELLTWLAADEDVQLTADDRVVARILPAHPVPAAANIASPDFWARAQAIWGQTPTGELLSDVVTDSRDQVNSNKPLNNSFLNGSGSLTV